MVENGDDSWLQDDVNGEEASQAFQFIETPSYVALISDDSSDLFCQSRSKRNLGGDHD